MEKKLFLFIAISLFCLTMAYPWKLEQSFAYGSHEYKESETLLEFNLSENVFTGIKYTNYAPDSSNEFISSVSFPYYAAYEGKTFVIEPFLYPERKNSSSKAQGVFIKNIFEVYRNPVKNIWGQLSLNLGMAFQKTQVYHNDASYTTKEIPQITYELQYNHDFYKQFGALVSATLFHYLTSLNNVSLPHSIMDQRKLGFLQTGRSLTELPAVSFGVELSRAYNAQHPANLILGYNYIDFKTDIAAIHSLRAGFKMNISKKTNFSFIYNLILQSSFDKKNYYLISFSRVFL